MRNAIILLLLFSFKLIKTTEYCSGIDSITIEGNCSHIDFEEDFTCRNPISEGTMAKIFCKSGYNKLNQNVIDRIFCKSGRWDYEPFQCQPICGVQESGPHNNTAPWYAQIRKGDLTICGGTIISEKVIISSAYCLWDKQYKRFLDKDIVSVIVDLTLMGPTKIPVNYTFHTISEIHISDRFKNSFATIKHDIALFVLDRYIVFNDRIAPICIDWLNGKINESRFNGSLPTCVSKIADGPLKITGYFFDCINDTVFNESSVICKHRYDENETFFGIQGNGLLIERIVDGQEVYFLRGIVNNLPIEDMVNRNHYSVTFINIEHHSAVILEYLTKFSGKTLNNEWESNNLLHCDIPYIPNVLISVEYKYGTRINLSFGSSVFELSKIVYTCSENYRILGTTTNFCEGVNWAENHPVCIYIDDTKNATKLPNGACVIPNIPNLIITSIYLEKEITENFVQNLHEVKYKCAKHYHLLGRLTNSCINGKWKWRKHPLCLSVSENPSYERCEVPFIPNCIILRDGSMPRNISVGDYVGTSNTITYSCTENRLLHGVSSNYCHEGKWMTEHPKCVKLVLTQRSPFNCELPVIQNGFTVIEVALKENISSPIIYISRKSRLYYRCKRNYLLVGVIENQCNWGQFKYDHPECIKSTINDCEIPVVADGIVFLEGEVKKIASFGSYVNNFNIISYKCKEKHLLQGRRTNNCINGEWTDEHPICIKYCSSGILEGITYSAICEFDKVRIPCDQHLRVGTIAKIFCQYGYRKPNPFVRDELICDDFGHWDNKPYRCQPECGTEVTETIPYIRGGEKVNITAVPWQVAIYSSLKGTPEQICGGTIITAKLVLSAAHCFWDTAKIDASYITVVAGKRFRFFQADESLSPQFFNVSEIIIPTEFRGPLQFYHQDIAILVLNGYIQYKPYIKPICIQWFDHEEKTVQSGLEGSIPGWGKTSLNLSSKELILLHISTLSHTDCVNATDIRFRDKIAGDKFCVLSQDKESVCPGDSGGGFTISRMVNGIKTHFLWGIVSVGLSDNDDCNNVNLTALTNVQHYRDFISYYERQYYYN